MPSNSLNNTKRNIRVELEAYARLEEEAGQVCGKSWYESSANLQQTERLIRCNIAEDPLRECKSSDQAIALLVRIIAPAAATDAASIKQCWEVLRGPSPYRNGQAFVAGFLVGAHGAAWRRCDLADAVPNWLDRLTPEQMDRLREFALANSGAEEVGDLRYDECSDVYQLCYYATHSSLPPARPDVLNRLVRAWFLDSIETDRLGCFIEPCIEAFLLEAVDAVLNRMDEGAAAEEHTLPDVSSSPTCDVPQSPAAAQDVPGQQFGHGGN